MRRNRVLAAVIGLVGALGISASAMTADQTLEPLPYEDQLCGNLAATSLDVLAGKAVWVRWKETHASGTGGEYVLHPNRNSVGIECKVSFFEDAGLSSSVGGRAPQKFLLMYAGPEEITFRPADFDRRVDKIVCRGPRSWRELRIDTLAEALAGMIDLGRFLRERSDCPDLDARTF